MSTKKSKKQQNTIKTKKAEIFVIVLDLTITESAMNKETVDSAIEKSVKNVTTGEVFVKNSKFAK